MEYKVIYDLDELPEFNKKVPIFFDIETDGLYVKERLIQLYQVDTGNHIYILDLAPDKEAKNRDKLIKEFKDKYKDYYFVGYNLSYDLGALEFIPERFDDLFYIVKIAYPQFIEFSLDKVVNKMDRLKGLYDGIDKKAMQKSKWKAGLELTDEQLRYASLDVYSLSEMWKDLRIREVIRNNLAYRVDILSLRYALRYQLNGLIPDKELILKDMKKLDSVIVDLKSKLPDGLNVNSSKQVCNYIGEESSNKATLLRSEHPDALTILELRRNLKAYNYLKSVLECDKVYSRFNPAGAISGRFTSKGGDLKCGLNSQQIPRQFQYIFKQDTEDTKVLYLDYSNLELRTACAMWGIRKMREFFIEGKDLHIEMAKIISGKPMPPKDYPNINKKGIAKGNDPKYVNEADRQSAKAANFGFIYGMNITTFIEYAYDLYGVKLTEAEAKEIRDEFFTLYPEAIVIHNVVWANYKKPDFFVYTALGRPIKGRRGTDMINTPIQGTGAEVTKLAIHYMVKEDERVLRLIENVVHDSIQLRVPKDEYDYWFELLRNNMLKSWREMSKKFKFKDIPMEVDK